MALRGILDKEDSSHLSVGVVWPIELSRGERIRLRNNSHGIYLYAGSFIFFAGSAYGKKDAFAWYTADKGLAKVDSTNKLIMIDVYTKWCGWCKKLESEVFSRSEIQGYLAKKFIPIKLNAEDSKSRVSFAAQEFTYAQLARALGVTGFPIVLFLESNGQLLYKLPGYLPPDEFMKVLKFFGEREYEKDKEGD